MELAVAEWLEYRKVQEAKKLKPQSPTRAGSPQEEQEMSLEVGYMTVYISTYRTNHNQVGFSGLAVNDQGRVLRAWTVARDRIMDPVALTLHAIRAVQFC